MKISTQDGEKQILLHRKEMRDIARQLGVGEETKEREDVVRVPAYPSVEYTDTVKVQKKARCAREDGSTDSTS